MVNKTQPLHFGWAKVLITLWLAESSGYVLAGGIILEYVTVAILAEVILRVRIGLQGSASKKLAHCRKVDVSGVLV